MNSQLLLSSENRNRNITLIDFDNPDNNLFHVTDEWKQQNAAHRNRADVVFLINGIPVAVVETKNAGKPDGLALGVEQIRRYHDETPEMFTTVPNSSVSRRLLDFLYGVTWSVTRKNLFNWKTDESTNYAAKSQNLLRSRSFLEGAAAVHYLPEAETTNSPKLYCVNTRRVQWRK